MIDYNGNDVTPLEIDWRKSLDEYGPDEKIEIQGMQADEIKAALYYSYYISNLSGTHRPYTTLMVLAETLGFKLSADLKSLIVPDRFIVKG